MTVVELDIRHKELIMKFKKHLKERGKEQFCCDDLRKFLETCELPYIRLLIDCKGNLNLGSLIRGMLNADNPIHRINWVAWKTDGLYNRRIGIYQFTTP